MDHFFKICFYSRKSLKNLDQKGCCCFVLSFSFSFVLIDFQPFFSVEIYLTDERRSAQTWNMRHGGQASPFQDAKIFLQRLPNGPA